MGSVASSGQVWKQSKDVLPSWTLTLGIGVVPPGRFSYRGRVEWSTVRRRPPNSQRLSLGQARTLLRRTPAHHRPEPVPFSSRNAPSSRRTGAFTQREPRWDKGHRPPGQRLHTERHVTDPSFAKWVPLPRDSASCQDSHTMETRGAVPSDLRGGRCGAVRCPACELEGTSGKEAPVIPSFTWYAKRYLGPAVSVPPGRPPLEMPLAVAERSFPP